MYREPPAEFKGRRRQGGKRPYFGAPRGTLFYNGDMLHRSGPDARLALWRTAGWLAAVIGGAMALLAGIEMNSPALTIPGATVLVLGGLGLWLVRTMSYDIGSLELVVRMGPFRRVIPLECIEGVLPAHLRTQALPHTLDYLAVVYRKNGRPKVAHLYPADPGDFVDALVARAPFLEKRGDRLLRVPTLGQLR